jgi:hypothetical protein
MQPITINSQLAFKRYYQVNLYLMMRRKVIWIMLALAFVMLLLAFLLGDNDSTFMYLAVFYFAYVLLMPGLIYLKAKNLFKKVPAMREYKRYEFTPENIKVDGETVKLETAWSNVTKAFKRKHDYILFTTGGRAFFSLSKSDFVGTGDVAAFEQLVKQKVTKNNF